MDVEKDKEHQALGRQQWHHALWREAKKHGHAIKEYPSVERE